MAIWNCTDDDNELASLLASCLPEVDPDAEMLKMEPAALNDLSRRADSVTDCLLAQQAALADLLAHADTPNLSKHTIRDAGWLLRDLTQLHEIVRRIADTAGAFGGEDREFHKAMQARDAVALARLTQ